ncbi:nitroreductase family protein [Odoribacter sp. OttesenSCG-928-J03]|nr:nitroreductase family protein [Odoribacter sp. OttesenSCG-928-J03]
MSIDNQVRADEPQSAIETIMNRKSVRKYQDRQVEEEKISVLLKAGMAAPSGKDVRPWEFVVVADRGILNAMAEGLPYAKMLKNAPLAIVVCGNTEASSYWYVDCSTAAQNILLAAEAQGLGAVWTAAYPYDDRMQLVSEQLGLPDNIQALCVIPVGYPLMPHNPRDKYDESKIHTNKW